jgi:uncharacterized protein YjbJ (UPF0337 family)
LLSAAAYSVLGGLKETVGNLTGMTGVEKSGANQKAEGDVSRCSAFPLSIRLRPILIQVEYKAAQAQGYAEGTKDKVGGKIDNVVGAVTGDKEQQVVSRVHLQFHPGR